MWLVPVRRADAPAIILSDDLVLVLSTHDTRPLSGRLFPLILPMVDGRRSVADIADALDGRATLADVIVGIEELIELGVLAPAPADAAQVEIAPEPPPGAADVPEIVAVGDAARRVVAAFASALRRAGTGRVRRDVRVVLAGDHRAPELRDVNADSLRSGTPWLLVTPFGPAAWVGPLFEPARRTPCWECLDSRLGETFPIGRYLARHHPAVAIPSPVPRADADALDRAAPAIVRLLDTRSTGRDAHIAEVDAHSGAVREHPVVHRPGCRACGGGRRISGGARLTARDEDAGIPIQLARQIDPITGIVSRVTSTPHGPVHVAVADHVFPPEIDEPESIWRGLRRRTAASGTTAATARLRAIAESVERYSGVYREGDEQRRGTYRELGSAAIHPNDVMMFSDAQYAGRDASNRRDPHRAVRIAEPFDDDAPYAWTAVRRIGSDERRWLPTALCYYGDAPDRERGSCLADSNGCAAGESFDGAIVSGFLELVERDAVATWWFNRLVRPAVDLTTVPDPLPSAIAAHAARLGRTLRVLDVTTDFDIPVFAALSSDADGGRLTVGFGAALQPLKALRHALLEVGLFLPEIEAGRRRHLFSGPEPAGAYLQAAEVRPWSAWAGAAIVPVPAEHATVELARLAAVRGLDVFVLDQTRSDVGVPVARVVVPGLRPLRPRFAPGRLFDVPVALGWRDRAAGESHLNPTSLLV
jgi:ribosomal protein S12 methylthiotransferase accessory factor